MSARVPRPIRRFYSHVNYSVTKIGKPEREAHTQFYSHVNYSVTKIYQAQYRVS